MCCNVNESIKKIDKKLKNGLGVVLNFSFDLKLRLIPQPNFFCQQTVIVPPK